MVTDFIHPASSEKDGPATDSSFESPRPGRAQLFVATLKLAGCNCNNKTWPLSTWRSSSGRFYRATVSGLTIPYITKCPMNFIGRL
jgi:hypothetical protein